jgi:kynureninase
MTECSFARPPGMIYLDGNSLGPWTAAAGAALDGAVAAWKERLILGWTEGPEPWFDMSRAVAAKLAPLIGAAPHVVAVGQSTTVNLHQLLASFYEPSRRSKILIDATSFPSDRYAVTSHLVLRGRDETDLVVVPSDDGVTVDEERVIHAMTDEVGVAVLPAVVYTSGQLLDMERLTAVARERGVVILWDCSHSAGIVPHRFADVGIEIAFGCGYKYLNGGPGAPAWMYISETHKAVRPGLAGWFGCDPARQFEMADTFYPARDAGRFLAGTPHVFSLAPLSGSLDVLAAVGIDSIRDKSLGLTEVLRERVEERLAEFGVTVVTPRGEHRRGGHVTLAHPHAGILSKALRLRNVIPDFRPPNLLRLCPHPLYNTMDEIETAVEVLREMLTTRSYERVAAADSLVT